MKNNLIISAFLGLFLLAFGVNANNVYNTQKFEISEDAPSVESATKAWTLKYHGNEDLTLTIEMVPGKRGKQFVVYSKYFEVSYNCCKKGFGAKKIKAALSKVDSDLTAKVLDQTKIYRQSVISPNQVTEKEALGLIASYLPELVKEEYKYLFS